MNTYNHHRIIKEFANRIRHESIIKDSIISDDEIRVLKEASDYTDVFASESDYYFYHFYYDIEVEPDTDSSDGIIILKRSNRGNSYFKDSMNKCDCDNKIKDSKLFFTTINDFSTIEGDDRAMYLQNNNPIDRSNQSDCVAFLHAMGSDNEPAQKSEKIFVEHIRRCLSEFLFLKDKTEAFFMLGIALHGIMDSFTPSHTGFKKYSLQEMALHAQGDVMPFTIREYNFCVEGDNNIGSTTEIPDALKDYFMVDEGYREKKDVVSFDPGQYTKDGETDSKARLAAILKGYNNDDHLNAIEYEMFKIFIESFLDKENDTDIKSLYGGSTDLSYSYWTRDGKQLELCSKIKLNEILKEKEYKDNAYCYSEAAINVVRNVYVKFLMERQKCLNNYDNYKAVKPKVESIFTDICQWREKYDMINKECDGSKFSLYLMRNMDGINVHDVIKMVGTVLDTVKGTVNEVLGANGKLVEENQKINPEYRLYDIGKI